MTQEEILNKAEELQNECHVYVNAIKNEVGEKCTHQDAVNAWIYLKLAELILKNKQSNE